MNSSIEEKSSDMLGVLRRRWYFPTLIIPSVLLLAVFLAYALPPQYTATGTIMLEPSSIPADLVRTTVASYADQQIELVRKRVMTPEKLKEIVVRLNPYPKLKEGPIAKARSIADDTTIERVDPITLKPLEESTTFSIHYANPNPVIAAKVAEQLANLFLTYNRVTRTEAAAQNYAFLKGKSQELADSIREMEARMAQFKSQYGNALPDAQKRNADSLDRTQRDLDGLEGEIRVAEEHEALLALQLSQVSPSLVAAVSDRAVELAKLKADLADAEQRYTPDHPDVKRLRRAIAALIAQPPVSTPGGVRPDNPEYLTISSQLDAARSQLAALRASAARARTQISQYSGFLQMTPEVERRYSDLSRDYDIAQKQFSEIQEKLRDAALAQTLESEQRGERFTLLRAPYPPDSPSSPNRLGIILLGIVLGAGLAFGLVAIRESTDPHVRSSKDLRTLSSIAIIGSIPIVRNRGDQRRRVLVWGCAATAFLVATVLVVLVVVHTDLTAPEPQKTELSQ